MSIGDPCSAHIAYAINHLSVDVVTPGPSINALDMKANALVTNDTTLTGNPLSDAQMSAQTDAHSDMPSGYALPRCDQVPCRAHTHNVQFTFGRHGPASYTDRADTHVPAHGTHVVRVRDHGRRHATSMVWNRPGEHTHSLGRYDSHPGTLPPLMYINDLLMSEPTAIARYCVTEFCMYCMTHCADTLAAHLQCRRTPLRTRGRWPKWT